MSAEKKLSVEDILAACRGGGSPSVPTEVPVVTEKPVAAKAAEPAPETAKKAAPSSSGSPAIGSGPMSVSDILAAARGKKPAVAEPPKVKAPPAEKVTATAAKAASAPKATPKPTGPKDTSSILAAARAANRPGPMTKEEAAKKASVATKSAGPVLPPLPEKPAYAVAKPKVAADPAESRRGFLSVFFGSFLAMGFTCLSAFTGLWGLGLARFMFPNILTEPPSKFKVGFPADFAPNTVSEKFKAQFGVWVVNSVYEGQRQIVALKTVCTHLGCTPNWLDAERKFKCPCHGSGFYIDGINFEGPAPRPLERYSIRLADDGQLEIDKSKKYQQEMGQWSNPSCFVNV